MITHHVSRIISQASRLLLVVLIRAYRLILSPLLNVLFTPLGLGCRFTPTCSQYALEAVQQHGPWRGSLLAARRICRCHPCGGSGYDPVPHLNLNPDLNLTPLISANREITIKSRIKIKNLLTSSVTRKI